MIIPREANKDRKPCAQIDSIAERMLNIVLVCHCFREAETRIRIISARKANKDEAHVYWSNQP